MNKESIVITLNSLAKNIPSTKINNENLILEKKTIKEHFPLHRHEFLEIEFVLKGSGIMLLNGKKQNIEKGLFYILRTYDFHEYFPTSETEIFTVSFDHSLFPAILANYYYLNDGVFISVAKNETFEYISTLLNAFKNEYDNKFPLKSIHMKNILSILLISLLRLTDSVKSNQNLSGYISSALNYINLNFSNNPTLSDVAKFININPSYFSTIFKQEMKKTYSEYLADIKISYAKKLLKTSNLTVIEICNDCGFNSISNFSRAFHKHVGCSPSEYRNLQ